MNQKSKRNKKAEKEDEQSRSKSSTGYVMIPIEKRFLVLYTFMKKYATKKMMIIVSHGSATKLFEELMHYEGFPVVIIQEQQSRSERKDQLTKFRNSNSGVLVCSERATDSMSLPSVDWLIQFDPPSDFSAYIERLRKLSSSGKGESLLFTTEEEMEVIRHIKSEGVEVELVDVQWSKVINIQMKLEKLVKQQHSIYLGARQAFAAYVKAYNEHPFKHIYSIKNINLTKAAKAYGFSVPPFVDLTCTSVAEEGEGDKRKRNSESANIVQTKTIYRPVKKLKSGKSKIWYD